MENNQPTSEENIAAYEYLDNLGIDPATPIKTKNGKIVKNLNNILAEHLKCFGGNDELEKIKHLCDGLDPIKVVELIKKHSAINLILEHLADSIKIESLELEINNIRGSEKWIKVEEANPTDYQDILVLLENREVFKAMYCDDTSDLPNYTSQYFKFNEGIKITHWMPYVLPTENKPTE